MEQKKRFGHKGILSLIILCCALTAVGCGSGTSSDSLHFMENSAADDGYSGGSDSAAEQENSSGGIGDETSDDSAGATADGADEEGGDVDDGTTSDGNSTSSNINTEMLVYTCNLSVDTLDYDKSVTTFHSMLSAVGGFVESESYTDGHSSSIYYIEDYDKNKQYNATVRVPHDKYNEFLNGADQLGDVRSKSSNVLNVGQEYSDLNTSLQIYEAKEKRYINLLSTITDDEQAIRVEKELTELQVKIAKIKTRMNEIKEDVDYSTIDIQIHEVTKYEEKKEPEKKDTFFQRLGNTIKDTWKHFLIFLEAVLFLIIRVLPYAVIILAIIIVIYRIQKHRNRERVPQIFPFPGTASDGDSEAADITDSSDENLTDGDLPENDLSEGSEPDDDLPEDDTI